tara:strand:+ start:21 stop:194 length:174 start_codon:yes stop_codon:yes gene_type:complete
MNPTDPVWSIFIMLAILLVSTTYYIYYIMNIAYVEMKDGNHETPQQEELLQLSLFEN